MDDFWTSLEYRVCREMHGVDECRAVGMWCDGIIASVVHREEDPVRVSGQAWVGLGPTQQEAWAFELLLPAGVDPDEVGRVDMVPPDDVTGWLTIDRTAKRLVVALGEANEMVAEILRRAVRADVAAIQRVRNSVRENRLVSRVIADDEVIEAIEQSGRGWVIEWHAKVVAFAIGNGTTGNVWALFVDPEHEGRGYGRRLLDEMVRWLWSRGLKQLSLSTEPGTRAERFYERAGWQRRELLPNGEVLFELQPSWLS